MKAGKTSNRTATNIVAITVPQQKWPEEAIVLSELWAHHILVVVVQPKDSTCNKCGRRGHWGKVCLNPPDKKPKFETKRVNVVEQQTAEMSDGFEQITFHSININIDCMPTTPR